MESITNSVYALPRAVFVCDSCARPVILVDDVNHRIWDNASQTGRELHSSMELSESDQGLGAFSARIQGIDEPYSLVGETVALPFNGASSSAQSHASSPPCKGDQSLLVPSSIASCSREPTDGCIPQIKKTDAGGKVSTVLYPLCCGCLDAAIADLAPASAHEKRLIRKYEKALKRLERSNRRRIGNLAAPAGDCRSSTVITLQELEKEEAQLLNEISSLELSMSEKESQQLAVMAELSELHMWHVEFWLLFSNHLLRTMRHEEVSSLSDVSECHSPLLSGN